MDKENVDICVVGTGSIARIAHFPSIENIENAKLTAVCDIDDQLAKEAAQEWGAEGCSSYTDYEKMLQAEGDNLDVVIIATPNNLHYEQGIAAAQAGVHAIVEKPLAVTNKEAWEMVEVARENGTKLMVGCNQRFWHQHEIGRQLIEDGAIGDVKMGRSSLHESWDLYHEKISNTKFRSSPTEAGGGAIYDVGAHRIDLINYLMGSEITRVVGVAKRTATPEEYTTLDDTVWILLEFENGKTAAVSCDRFSPAVSNITEVYGEKGTMFMSSEATNPFQSAPLAIYSDKDYGSWDELPEIIRKYRYPTTFWADESPWAKEVDKRWVSIYPPREWSYQRMLNHFIECVKEDKEPIIKPEDGAMAIEVMAGVFHSMRTDSWAELPLEEEIIPPHYQK